MDALKMNEEQLILLVQEYSLLYDLQDPNYSNQSARENAWEEIANTLKCKSAECKNKWKNLRDSFRKSIKNRETKSVQAASNKKAWRFKKQIEFLKKHVREQRVGRTNIAVPLSSPAGDDADCTEYDEDNIHSPANSTIDEGPSGVHSPASTIPTSGPPLPRKRKSSNSTPSSAAMLQEYMKYKKEKDSNKSGGHLTKYFTGIEEILRTLATAQHLSQHRHYQNFSYSYNNSQNTQNNVNTQITNPQEQRDNKEPFHVTHL